MSQNRTVLSGAVSTISLNETSDGAFYLTPSAIINQNFYFFVIGFGAFERLIGGLINAVVFIIIVKYKKLHTPSNVLLLSLAAADILGMFPVPLEIATSILWTAEDPSMEVHLLL